jgi:very-short-patch-repair endonuclease/ribosomal protein L44E
MQKKLKYTTNQIIDKAIVVHGNTYIYEHFIYNGTNIKSIITCSIHGNFQQRPVDHINNRQGCPICAGNIKYTKSDFIIKARLIHKEKYDYSKVEYKTNKIKIEIFCNACNMFFWQTPHMHLQGQGCIKCSGSKKYTTQEFVEKSIKIHGNKYNYSKIEYVNAHTKIKIFCNKCMKYFFQNPSEHLNGQSCPFCIGKYKTKEEIIFQFQQIHGIEKFDYSKVEYVSAKTKVIIRCKKCKKDFKQTPNNHLNGNGCFYCKCSNGEEKIRNKLKDNNISTKEQIKFNTCKNIKSLIFDFYLIDYNILIEYDGKQHFEPVSFCKDQSEESKKQFLKEIQHRDSIKTNWAKENNIPLIRFNFREEKYLEEKLNKLIKFLKNNII